MVRENTGLIHVTYFMNGVEDHLLLQRHTAGNLGASALVTQRTDQILTSSSRVRVLSTTVSPILLDRRPVMGVA